MSSSPSFFTRIALFLFTLVCASVSAAHSWQRSIAAQGHSLNLEWDGIVPDAAGRLEKRQSGTVTPDGKWRAEGEEAYQWDKNGRLALAKNKETKLQWFYDKAGNLTTEHQHYLSANLTAVWRHAYDPLGNRVATLRPDGHKIERMTYGAGHVHGITLDGEEIISFER
ncbi:MAG: RHS repeat protein, partial [Zoogloeaceae bacterium]|nr:RHS repeat protein [Zoogloeaceae bacterium]